ncbi:hypothetical protein [Ekhidna sp.]
MSKKKGNVYLLGKVLIAFLLFALFVFASSWLGGFLVLLILIVGSLLLAE